MSDPSDSIPESGFLALFVKQNFSVRKMCFSFSSIGHTLINFFKRLTQLVGTHLNFVFTENKCFIS